MSLLRLAMTAVSGGAVAKFKEIRPGVILALAAGACAMIAAIFLIVAVTIALATEFGTVQACLIMASVFTVLCGILILRRGALASRKLRATKTEPAAVAASLESGALSKSALNGPLMALAVGYALARKD